MFNQPIDWELVMDCLGIMGKGMLGIFIVILVIWALVALVWCIRLAKRPRKQDPGEELRHL